MVPTCSVRIPRVPTYSLYPTSYPFAYKPVTFFGIAFQQSSAKILCSVWYQKGITSPPSGWSVFARHYSRNRFYFLFLRVLRCFSSPGSPRTPMDSVYGNLPLDRLSSLIRISTGHRIFAPHRSFSQLVTSFFGAMYQGILRMLFVAWSFLYSIIRYILYSSYKNSTFLTRLIPYYSF